MGREAREGGGVERAVLVGAGDERLLGELGRLATTLGVEVVGALEQARRDARGYLGRGKREELAELVSREAATMVIADDELTAAQARLLEKGLGASVVDRTELIIRIFELHARDRASRLEVELADLSYRLPRVKGRNEALSRLGGGGATTRGPGEQQLEYDRRVIRERMRAIEGRLAEERSAREVRGARLREVGPPTVALVGYTNAGKTTLLNALSGESRSTADRLFETLETTTRLVRGRSDGGKAARAGSTDRAFEESPASGVPASGVPAPGGPAPGGPRRPDFVVTDTVGFIRKLPTQLVHSFASTLEAARDADLVVVCADAASEELEFEVHTVLDTLTRTLGEEGAASSMLCLNKMDRVSRRRADELGRRHPDAVRISASAGRVGPLLEAIYASLLGSERRVALLIPHADYACASRLYGRAEIHSSVPTEEGVLLDVTLPARLVDRYARFRRDPVASDAAGRAGGDVTDRVP